MNLQKIIFIFFLSIWLNLSAQDFKEQTIDVPVLQDSLYGTLLTPLSLPNPTLVILIPGSGPTDRNGNQATLKNNSLKLLAEALTKNGIATYRFDQSIISIAKLPNFKEENYTFSNLIVEVETLISYFRNQNLYAKIVIAGHSQGSLVGMLAVKNGADAFISLNGAGQSIDKILYEQLNNQVPHLESSFSKNLKQLKNKEPVTDINPILLSLFRPSVQPFLSDWMQYNPSEIIANINVPILIVGGTKDIQVSVSEAKMLKNENPNAHLLIIENMNHIFKEIKGQELENQMSYMNPDLPIMHELVDNILLFLKGL